MVENLRVLVVDDESAMRLGIERTLRDFCPHIPEVERDISFAIASAASGEEALTSLAKQPADIILLDHKLPGLSGLDVLERLRGLASPPLVIMITAYATLEAAVDAMRRGAYDFVAKPFTPEELRNTVRKAAGRVLLAREARRLAEEKRQVRFQFIRLLGHELKAPLAAVEGYLYILRNQTLGADLKAYTEIVNRSLARISGMRKLIADLLDLTRLESGHKKRDLQPISLQQIAAEAMELIQEDARRLALRLNLEIDERGVFVADRGEIEMILANLLSNAVKYNRQGGAVTLRIRAAEGEACLEAVSDTHLTLPTIYSV